MMKFCSVALFLLAGCVTSGDIREIAASVEELEAVVGNPGSTPQAITDQLAQTKADLAEVATKIDERTETVADSISEGGLGGVLPALLSGVFVWLARNRREEKRWGSPEAPKA